MVTANSYFPLFENTARMFDNVHSAEGVGAMANKLAELGMDGWQVVAVTATGQYARSCVVLLERTLLPQAEPLQEERSQHGQAG